MIERTPTILSTFAMIYCVISIGCGSASTESATLVGKPSLPIAPSPVSPTHSTHAEFYTVSTYDESFDPSDDLQRTIAQADAENKRIILQVGGEWCGWCSRITDYMSTNSTVRSHIDKNFLVMKVTYPGKHADEFLAAYPKCEAYPHLFVLEKDGGFLHSQGTGELEKGKGYDEDMFMAFLTKWTR